MMTFPIFTGVGAGIGMVLSMAIWGGAAITWGLIGGAALGTVFGIITDSTRRKQ